MPNIKCPSCQKEFPLEEALTDELKNILEKEKQELRAKMLEYKSTAELKIRQQEEEFLKREREKEEGYFRQSRQLEEKFLQQSREQEELFRRKMDEELRKANKDLEEELRKSISGDYQNKIAALEDLQKSSEEKLKAAREKELDFLRKENDLKHREAELEITLQKKLMAEREHLKEQLVREETERNRLKEEQFAMRQKELEKQLEDQKKLIEEMKRKAEQGSMQLQGEVQELLLEAMLQSTFPFDRIEPVAKGIRGADCIQVVHNQFGAEAGKIIYESKRTKDFTHEWIEKLKHNMRLANADAAIIVTQTMPKDMVQFGEKDGVYICSFSEVKSLAVVMRNAILKLAEARRSQVNKGEKMSMLYDYLTGNEFSEQWKAIREGFLSMKLSIQKERDAMEKLWKMREKQLEKVLLNAAHIKGSVEGIAGSDVNLNLLEEPDADEDDTRLLI
jgi:hypothetical protein